ncbi:hypothetical protein BDI4_350008 [Burkholderia diffusa]|nr:hypothetical protein BDI4_350008 [Burkholderia diffusa]
MEARDEAVAKAPGREVLVEPRARRAPADVALETRRVPAVHGVRRARRAGILDPGPRQRVLPEAGREPLPAHDRAAGHARQDPRP